MADYYQLIARAVSGLPQNTPDTRKAIYDRARRALINQLRSIQPPVPDADIERESKSLEEAVARLENETAAALVAAKKPPSTPAEIQKPENPQRKPEQRLQKPLRQPDAPKTETIAPAENVTPPAAAAPTGPALAGPALAGPPPAAEPPARPAEPEPSKFTLPKTVARPEPSESASEAAAAPRDKVEATRPIAPSAIASRKPVARIWIMGAAAVLLVASIAGAALWLKQNAEDPARRLKQEAATAPETKPGTGKIIERVGGAAPPPVAMITPAKPANGNTAPSTEINPQNAATSAQTIPVASRAALLIEAPEEATKIKTYVGTVLWTNTTKTTPAGSIVIMHGEASIPEAQLKFTFNLQQNDDASFPASHVLDLRFLPDATSKLTAIKELHMPELRTEAAPHGEPLHGGAVAITPTIYLVGLSRVDRDKAQNLDLLTQRGWIDLPMTLADGREAKLTLEKGIPGDKALSEALK